MFTLFELIRLLAMVGCAIAFAILAGRDFGISGCVAGATAGLFFGAVVGQLPLTLALYWMSRRFRRMTDDELLAELHDANCLTPNLHLLELKRRGKEIQRELPYIYLLLASTDMRKRTMGWAALTSVFPELVSSIRGYNPTDPTDECQTKCKPLLNASDHEDEMKQP